MIINTINIVLNYRFPLKVLQNNRDQQITEVDC